MKLCFMRVEGYTENDIGLPIGFPMDKCISQAIKRLRCRSKSVTVVHKVGDYRKTIRRVLEEKEATQCICYMNEVDGKTTIIIHYA